MLTTDHFLAPDKVTALEGATAGAIILLLMLGKIPWRTALLIFVSALTIAYFGTIPLAALIHAGPPWYGMIGCGEGFGAMYLFGGVRTILLSWESDPLAVLKRLVGLVRGERP